MGQWSFCQFLECQIPPIENFLATVLVQLNSVETYVELLNTLE